MKIKEVQINPTTVIDSSHLIQTHGHPQTYMHTQCTYVHFVTLCEQSLCREGPSVPCQERQSAEPRGSSAWGSQHMVSPSVNLRHVNYPALTAHLGTLGTHEEKNILRHQKGASLAHTKALSVGSRSIH